MGPLGGRLINDSQYEKHSLSQKQFDLQQRCRRSLEVSKIQNQNI